MIHIKKLLKLRLSSLLLPIVAVLTLLVTSQEVNAATYTVCDDSPGTCQFATMQAAIDDVATANGDTIQLGGAYTTTTGVTINKQLIINCNGVTMASFSGFTVSESNVTINGCNATANGAGENFVFISTGAYNTITINANTTTGYQKFFNGLGSYGDLINITSNNITHAGTEMAIYHKGTGSITGNNITSSGSGTFIDYGANGGASGAMLITGNTLSSNIVTSQQGQSAMSISDGDTFNAGYGDIDITVSGNNIYASVDKDLSYGISVGPIGKTLNGLGEGTILIQQNTIRNVTVGIGFMSPGASTENVSIIHNVFYVESGAVTETDGAGVRVNATGAYDNVNIKYNIFQGFTGADGSGIACNSAASISTMTFDYNAYYGNTQNTYGDGCTLSVGANAIEGINPAMTDPGNDDYSLLEVSYMIGAATPGSDELFEEIGAVDYVGARVTTITVDDSGGAHFLTIDEGVDAAAPTGDTVTVAAGTYAESVTIADKNLTLTGAGSGAVTINAANQSYGLSLSNVDSSTISGFTIAGNSSTVAGLYVSADSDSNTFSDLAISNVTGTGTFAMTQSGYSYDSGGGSNNYDGYIAIIPTKTGINGDMADMLTLTSGYDITSYANQVTPQSWNIGLILSDGTYMTFIFDNADYEAQSNGNDYLTSALGGGSFDCWVDDAFTYANGAYTYNSAAVETGCTGAVDLTAGNGSEITTDIGGGGIQFSSSDSNAITGTTLTSNKYGGVFSGTAALNTLGTMTFTTSLLYDLYSSSSADNTITRTLGQAVTSILASAGIINGLNTPPTATFDNDFSIWETGDVTINYKIIDADSDTSNISQTGTAGIEYSTDNSTWADATVSEADTEGLTELASATSPGSSHILIWDSATDLPTTEDSTVYLRIRPNDGTTDADAWVSSSAFGIDNVPEVATPSGGGYVSSRSNSPSTTTTTPVTPTPTTPVIIEPIVPPTVDTTTEPIVPTQPTVPAQPIVPTKTQKATAKRIINASISPTIDVVTNKQRVNIDLLYAPIAAAISEPAQPKSAESQQIDAFLEKVSSGIKLTAEEEKEFEYDSTAILQKKFAKTIGEDKKIIFLADTQKAKALQNNYIKQNKNIVVFNTSTIIGKGNVAAFILANEDGDINDEDASKKIFYAGDVSGVRAETLDQLKPNVPTVTNLGGKEVGENTLLWIVGKPDEKVSLFAVYKPEKEDSESWQTVEIGDYIIEKDGTAIATFNFKDSFENEAKDIEIIAQNEKGEGSKTLIHYNPALSQNIELLQLTDGELISTEEPTNTKPAEPGNNGLYTSVINAADTSKEEVQKEEAKAESRKLTGYAGPGTVIMITWKSLTYTSVVVADASQGYFEVNIPEELENGDHTVIAYSVKSKKLSNYTQLFFNKVF